MTRVYHRSANHQYGFPDIPTIYPLSTHIKTHLHISDSWGAFQILVSVRRNWKPWSPNSVEVGPWTKRLVRGLLGYAEHVCGKVIKIGMIGKPYVWFGKPWFLSQICPSTNPFTADVSENLLKVPCAKKQILRGTDYEWLVFAISTAPEVFRVELGESQVSEACSEIVPWQKNMMSSWFRDIFPSEKICSPQWPGWKI